MKAGTVRRLTEQNMQGFMAERCRPCRSLFGLLFLTEPWSLCAEPHVLIAFGNLLVDGWGPGRHAPPP